MLVSLVGKGKAKSMADQYLGSSHSGNNFDIWKEPPFFPQTF